MCSYSMLLWVTLVCLLLGCRNKLRRLCLLLRPNLKCALSCMSSALLGSFALRRPCALQTPLSI